MTEQDTPASAFAAGAIQLYTALLGVGETELSKPLLESTMNAAAAVNRLRRSGDWPTWPERWDRREELELAEELLRKSLFWICQAPDTTAQLHGGVAFREGLRLLLLIRSEEAQAPAVAQA